MKIVYFIDHLRPDGTQRFLTQLVKGLAERGHRQAVVCLNNSWDGEVVDMLHAAGCEVRIVGKTGLVSGVGLVSTWRWLKSERFDVAVTMLFAADVLGRPLARASGVGRIVTSLRARNVNYKTWQRWLVQRSMPLADVVVLNSYHLRDFALQFENASPDRLVIIPNGVMIDDYCQPYPRDFFSSEFGITHADFVIGSAGRMTYQKGFDLLLDAVARIPDRRVQLLLVGEGEDMPVLRQRAAKNGLNGSVHFAGYRRDLPRLLGALDLYVQPSRFEGMPNALLEAMAAGCPVIASAVDGNLDLIEDGATGWLIPGEDSSAMREAILDALADPEEASCRSKAAQRKVQSQYSTDSMVTAWQDLFSASS